ncbi:odorant receptor 85c-like [Cimex lectularius]|uniref:Odorant receptor n=1 Tax=Cimex lectularius TaxID=79782 RepID=A0A8I6S9F2_CIMLE|nr:odorant receptor 85c-like [Cimex lectularius]
MNNVIDPILKYSVAIAGDKKLEVYTLYFSFLNFLGFDWKQGGINVPVPAWVKFKVYPASYPIMMLIVSFLIIKLNVEVEPKTEFEMIKMINGFIVSMTFIAAFAKLLYLRIIKNDILELLNMSVTVGPISAEKPVVKDTIRSCVLYFILLNANVGTWTVGYLWLHNDLPFAAAFPWDESTVVGFSLSFNVDVLCAFYCSIGHTVLDISFPLVVSTMCWHIQRLEKLLSTLGKDYFIDRMILDKAVDLHVRLLRQVIVCYNQLIVAQSVYTVLHSCILIYAVVKVSNKVEAALSSVPMLSASYAQLYMYCSYGQLLTDKTHTLSFAAYNNEWYRCPPKLRKSLVLFLEATKRAVHLKGFGNIQASLANYLHSLQDSVSYFLVLKTLTSDENA